MSFFKKFSVKKVVFKSVTVHLKLHPVEVDTQEERREVHKDEVVVGEMSRYLFLAFFACTRRPPLLSPPVPSSAAPAPAASSGTESSSGPH